jgi:2,4-dienoyl-CoA reductase-like NADH-dependent reductase (Old Yellow Enzyme family)/thioredoxin reductase
MPAMSSRLCAPDGSVTQKTIDYYAERAKGGAGLLILETHYIDDKAAQSDWIQMGIYSNRLLSGMNQLAEAIHSHGAAVVVQLAHAGRQRQEKASKEQPLAPSAIPLPGGEMPREMTLAEIEGIQEAFAEAAVRAKMAGYDGVEIHGGHGGLPGQFLSPYSNKRQDKYGGSLENRALFSLEVIKRVRDKVGDGYIVGYRMSAEEYVPGGLTLKETSEFAKMLDRAGVDYINVSSGIFAPGSAHHIIPALYIPKAHNVHLAEAVRKVVRTLVINAGAHDVYTAEETLEQGKADLVALGRALIADPELPKKLAGDRIDDIRPCIRGNEGCLAGLFLGRPMRCEVNPTCGRESEFKITPAERKKKVMVIGGGIAGLEVARVAALRGHEVTISERSEELGGHLLEATVPEFKEETKELLDWAVRQVKKAASINVNLNTEATPSLIKELKPDVLMVAIGSDYIIPRVPGCDKVCAVTAGDVLLGKRAVGDKVVVVGAGLVGCETALYIAETLGKTVSIVEMLDEALPDLELLGKMALLERLEKASVEMHLGWCLDEIIDRGAICTDKNRQKHKIEADTVVLATGLGAREEAAEQFKGLAPEVRIVGDCAKARKIYHCFEDAWRTALHI